MDLRGNKIPCFEKKNSFCYVCANYMFNDQQIDFNENLQEIYYLYYNIKPIFKIFTPNKICSTCEVNFRKWKSGQIDKLTYGKFKIF